MTQQARLVCDQCAGVIPTGSAYLSGLSVTLVPASGTPQPFVGLDFCCTNCARLFAGANLTTGASTTGANPPLPPGVS